MPNQVAFPHRTDLHANHRGGVLCRNEVLPLNVSPDLSSFRISYSPWEDAFSILDSTWAPADGFKSEATEVVDLDRGNSVRAGEAGRLLGLGNDWNELILFMM